MLGKRAKPKQLRRRGPRSLSRGPRSAVFLPRGSFSSWVLTRLHTRYSKETLSGDLVFKPSHAIVGGRGSSGVSGEKSGQVKRARNIDYTAPITA